MASKLDRKELMRASLGNERKKVEDRFAAADAVLTARPLGLAGVTDSKADFSAEIVDGPKSVLTVPLENIHDNPVNARYIYDSDIIKNLSASIATRGQLVPAAAIRHPELADHYILIDGHYRKKALVAAGRSGMDLIVQESENDLELYKMSWLLNAERSAQSVLDNAIAWQTLLDQKLVSEGIQIAELLGVSPATVNKTLALLKLPTAAIEKMKEHPERFGVFIGYELSLASKSVSENELLQLIDRIVQEELSSREVASIRAKLEKGSIRKKKETSRQYKIRNGLNQIGVIKEWDSGKVSFEVTLPDPRERSAFLEELKLRFHLED